MIRKRTISCNDNRGNECILVAGAVVSSIETLLGHVKSLKCCLSSGASVITSSTPKILESINVEHPAGFIINNTCQSFQKEFGCGCTTLVCLIGYWATAMQDLSEMGVPATVIAALMDEALGEFEKVFENSSISLQSLQDKSSPSQDFTSGKSSALLGKRPSTTSKCFLQSNGKRAERQDVAGISDDCDWYFGDKEHFQRIQKAPFNLYRDMVCSNNAFEVKQDIGPEQFIDISSETEGLLDTFSTKSAQVKRESLNCNNTPHHKPTSNKCFVENPPENSAFGENYIKPLSPIDEFDACFDEVVEEYGTLEIAEAPKKMAQGSEKMKKTHSNFESSENSSIHELILENKDLFEFAAATAGHKTNLSKVYLRSRHLVDLPVVTKPEILSGSEELHTDNSSQSRRQSLGNSSKKDASDVSDMVKKQSECNNDVTEHYDSNSDVDTHWLGFLAHNLAHGNENEMKFALEILHRQYTISKLSSQEFYFSLDFIAVQTVVGPPSCNSCIVDGVVVMLSKRNDLLLTLNCHSPRRIMLVNGDMTCNYKHAGLKNPVEVKRVFEKEDFRDMSLGERKKWIKKVTSVFKSLRVDLVAVRGNVDVELRECLQGFSVVVLENLNYRQIEILSKMTNTSVVSYPLDFVMSDLGEAVVTRIWRSGWSSHEIKSSEKTRGIVTNTFVQLCLGDENTAKRNHVVQTLVLCAPVPDLVGDNESKFWNCVHRLRNAFADKRVLPGGGEIEQYCIKHLEKVKDTKVDDKIVCSLRQCTSDCVLFRPLIYDAFIRGLRKFLSRVYINVAEDPVETISENCVFDNFVCKMEGWKRAIRVVKLLLCSEYHIVTGM